MTATASPGSTVEVGGPSRALTFAILGAAVGLFIGLVERVSRAAWLRLRLGKNEGREWEIEGLQTAIGRDERAHVPLWGDPAVAPLHAVIHRQGRHYVIQDQGAGTLVNGQPVAQATLAPGSIIQIGRHTLEFLTKGTRSAAQVPGPIPMGAAMGSAPTGSALTASTGAITVGPTVSSAADLPSTSTVVALDGPLAGQRFPAQGEIGREGSAIGVPFDTTASRRHARISTSPGGLLLEDLGSTNGLKINGVKTPQGFLKPGDVFTIGITTFRVESH